MRPDHDQSRPRRVRARGGGGGGLALRGPALRGPRALLPGRRRHLLPRLRLRLARSLEGGVWPLWHPGPTPARRSSWRTRSTCCSCCSLGARATLAVSPPLHVLLAMAGAAALARRLGASPAGAAVSGGVFGLSGLMLGSVLFPVFHAAAWAPLAVERFLALVAAPEPPPRRRPRPRAGGAGRAPSARKRCVATALFAARPRAALARAPGRPWRRGKPPARRGARGARALRRGGGARGHAPEGRALRPRSA